jgi:hypothetical protein
MKRDIAIIADSSPTLSLLDVEESLGGIYLQIGA